MHVWDFMNEFIEELTQQLKSDEERWGNTWLARIPEGQEERTITRFNDYFDQFKYSNIPIPWLKIVGSAMICWIRDRHPEHWEVD